jgi:predicted nuclease of predicted toxin-antitoxin system
VKLALDHHYSVRIAESLRERGHEAISVSERGWHLEADESLLDLCSQEHFSLLTNNVSDFMPIHRRWQAQNRQHSGLIFTSDKSLPRTRAGIGQYVAALQMIFSANPGFEELTDQVLWLAPAEG